MFLITTLMINCSKTVQYNYVIDDFETIFSLYLREVKLCKVILITHRGEK